MAAGASALALLLGVAAGDAQAADPVVTAAGDIAGTPTDSAGTAALVKQIAPDRALTLGDNAYPSGTLSNFRNYYNPNWGQFKGITSPTPGNHDYDTSGAAGYFQYFGARAPAAYYSFNLGSWHLVALDSEIAMSSGSAQLQWLKNDLAANSGRCILAYWHRPRFTSSPSGGEADSDPLWRALYAAGADIVLNGHEHVYERFAPQNPDGVGDAKGIREFVAGTGGYSLHSFTTVAPNSQVRNNTTYGVLKLTLHAGGYDWRFVPAGGATFSDSGSDSCTRAADTSAPTAPTGLTATSSTGSVSLGWKPSTDDWGVAGYDVYRNGTLIAHTTSTSYVDSSVASGTSYSYVVKARDAAGNTSPASNTATVTATTAVLLLSDNFDSNAIDPARWTVAQGGSSVTAANQELEITHPAGDWTKGSLSSVSKLDLTGRSIQVQVKRAANNGSGGSTYGETEVFVTRDSTHYAYFWIAGGALTAWVDNGSSEVNLTTNWPAYSATAMQWLRFRESGGRLYFEYAAGSTSPGTWTTLASTADPFDLSSLTYQIQAGANVAVTDVAKFDDVAEN